MRYEMQNFIKFTKRKASDVGQSKKHNDQWKRERKLARKHKLQARKVA